MYFVICQNSAWRIYRENSEESYLSGCGEIETAIEISRLYGITLTEFYNLQTLRVANHAQRTRRRQETTKENRKSNSKKEAEES